MSTQNPEEPLYEIYGWKWFVPCTEEQMRELETILETQCDPQLETTKHKKKKFSTYFQNMRENLKEGYDCTGMNVDSNALKGYIAFSKEHPNHDHMVSLTEEGWICSTWEDREARFQTGGATCFIDTEEREDITINTIKVRECRAEEVMQTLVQMDKEILEEDRKIRGG